MASRRMSHQFQQQQSVEWVDTPPYTQTNHARDGPGGGDDRRISRHVELRSHRHSFMSYGAAIKTALEQTNSASDGQSGAPRSRYMPPTLEHEEERRRSSIVIVGGGSGIRSPQRGSLPPLSRSGSPTATSLPGNNASSSGAPAHKATAQPTPSSPSPSPLEARRTGKGSPSKLAPLVRTPQKAPATSSTVTPTANPSLVGGRSIRGGASLYNVIQSKGAPAMHTKAGSSPNFTPEVGDKLTTSLVALRRWTLLHHPPSSVNFAKKIDYFCEECIEKSGYTTVGGGNRQRRTSLTDVSGGPTTDEILGQTMGTVSLTSNLMKQAVACHSGGDEGAAVPGEGMLFLNDPVTAAVNDQGFAIALTPLYHVPLPAVLLNAVRVHREAFHVIAGSEDSGKSGAGKGRAANGATEGPTLRTRRGTEEMQEAAMNKIRRRRESRAPSMSAPPSVTLSALKRQALMDLLQNVRCITRIEVGDGGETVETIVWRHQNANNGEKGDDSREEGRTEEGDDIVFLRDVLLPLLMANKEHSRKANKRLQRDAKRALAAEQYQQILLVTTVLGEEQQLAFDALRSEEAKARHKLAAMCQIHKNAARRQQARRTLEDRFIVEQQKMVAAELSHRGDLWDEEVAAVRRIFLSLFTEDVKGMFMPMEAAQRKAIRDQHYLESYAIRRHLNTMFEKKLADRDETVAFEKKMRVLIANDEAHRFDAMQTAHHNIVIAIGAHLVTSQEHQERVEAILSNSAIVPHSNVMSPRADEQLSQAPTTMLERTTMLAGGEGEVEDITAASGDALEVESQ